MPGGQDGYWTASGERVCGGLTPDVRCVQPTLCAIVRCCCWPAASLPPSSYHHHHPTASEGQTMAVLDVNSRIIRLSASLIDKYSTVDLNAFRLAVFITSIDVQNEASHEEVGSGRLAVRKIVLAAAPSRLVRICVTTRMIHL